MHLVTLSERFEYSGAAVAVEFYTKDLSIIINRSYKALFSNSLRCRNTTKTTLTYILRNRILEIVVYHYCLSISNHVIYMYVYIYPSLTHTHTQRITFNLKGMCK